MFLRQLARLTYARRVFERERLSVRLILPMLVAQPYVVTPEMTMFLWVFSYCGKRVGMTEMDNKRRERPWDELLHATPLAHFFLSLLLCTCTYEPPSSTDLARFLDLLSNHGAFNETYIIAHTSILFVGYHCCPRSYSQITLFTKM